MKRTTIILPDGLASQIDRERRLRDVSAATIVREALEFYFTEHRVPPRYPFIGIGRSGGAESIGQNAEDILDREWADWIYEESGLAARQRAADERPADSPNDPPTTTSA
jgi:hypothetical protein